MIAFKKYAEKRNIKESDVSLVQYGWAACLEEVLKEIDTTVSAYALIETLNKNLIEVQDVLYPEEEEKCDLG